MSVLVYQTTRWHVKKVLFKIHIVAISEFCYGMRLLTLLEKHTTGSI